MSVPYTPRAQMTPRLRANRAIHGIGVDACEMRERLPPHRDCTQCRMVEDTILDAVEEARKEMMLPCAACAARGELVTRRMNSEPGECPHPRGPAAMTNLEAAISGVFVPYFGNYTLYDAIAYYDDITGLRASIPEVKDLSDQYIQALYGEYSESNYCSSWEIRVDGADKDFREWLGTEYSNRNVK